MKCVGLLTDRLTLEPAASRHAAGFLSLSGAHAERDQSRTRLRLADSHADFVGALRLKITGPPRRGVNRPQSTPMGLHAGDADAGRMVRTMTITGSAAS